MAERKPRIATFEQFEDSINHLIDFNRFVGILARGLPFLKERYQANPTFAESERQYIVNAVHYCTVVVLENRRKSIEKDEAPQETPFSLLGTMNQRLMKRVPDEIDRHLVHIGMMHAFIQAGIIPESAAEDEKFIWMKKYLGIRRT